MAEETGDLRENREHGIRPGKASGKVDRFMQNDWGWNRSSDLDMLSLNYGLYGLSK